MGSEHTSLCPSVVKKWEIVEVKPSAPTPITTRSLSTIDNDPYIETLAKTIYVYKAKEGVGESDPASVVEKALSKALVYYYPLAGRLRRRSEDGRLEVRCSGAGEGVTFIRASATCSVSWVDKLLEELVPAGMEVDKPLALQVTSFSCGGMTIGMSLSHSICDGFGASQFFRALAELASGSTRPTLMPLWDRHLLTSTHHGIGEVEEDSNSKLHDFPMSSVATSPYTPTDDMVREIVNVTSEDIKRLKAMIAEEEKMTTTTLEVLAAHVWRARCRALKLNPEGITVFGLAVGIRGVMEPPLPEGYYGNAFVKANVVLRAREVSEWPLCHIVKHIKEVKRRALEKRYVWEQVRETERMVKKRKGALEGGNAAFMLLTDWRQLGLVDHVDFGWKDPVNIIPLLPLNLPEICIFLPPPITMKGGVRVLVTLPTPAMPDFMQHLRLISSSSTPPCA